MARASSRVARRWLSRGKEERISWRYVISLSISLIEPVKKGEVLVQQFWMTGVSRSGQVGTGLRTHGLILPCSKYRRWGVTRLSDGDLEGADRCSESSQSRTIPWRRAVLHQMSRDSRCPCLCSHERTTVPDNQNQQKNMNDLFLFKMHRKHIFIFSQNIKLATPKI